MHLTIKHDGFKSAIQIIFVVVEVVDYWLYPPWCHAHYWLDRACLDKAPVLVVHSGVASHIVGMDWVSLSVLVMWPTIPVSFVVPPPFVVFFWSICIGIIRWSHDQWVITPLLSVTFPPNHICFRWIRMFYAASVLLGTCFFRALKHHATPVICGFGFDNFDQSTSWLLDLDRSGLSHSHNLQPISTR